MIAINKSIKDQQIPATTNLEVVFLKFTFVSLEYLLVAGYMAPGSPNQDFASLVRIISLAEKYRDAELILLGDFNLPSIQWNNNPLAFVEL